MHTYTSESSDMTSSVVSMQGKISNECYLRLIFTKNIDYDCVTLHLPPNGITCFGVCFVLRCIMVHVHRFVTGTYVTFRNTNTNYCDTKINLKNEINVYLILGS